MGRVLFDMLGQCVNNTCLTAGKFFYKIIGIYNNILPQADKTSATEATSACKKECFDYHADT